MLWWELKLSMMTKITITIFGGKYPLSIYYKNWATHSRNWKECFLFRDNNQCKCHKLRLLLLLSHFSRVWLCVTPQDGSPQGSPILGILQARTLEWVAISLSNAWKWKVKVKMLSYVWLLVTLWTAVYQAPPSRGLSRQEYWSGLPLPSLKLRLTYFYWET